MKADRDFFDRIELRKGMLSVLRMNAKRLSVSFFGITGKFL